MNKIETIEFYNNFDKKLIQDYLQRNKRIESAILALSKFIPVSSERILDIGCGLGWSSHEFARFFDQAEIQGIDLSPVLIDQAKKIFPKENLTFQVLDITSSLPEGKNDAVVMIDVYEHIPKKERAEFHSSIKKSLKDQGRLLMACPSKFHQEYLKRNNPKGLQPIDEDVDFKDISQIAKDIGGELIYFNYQKIWRNYDYFYAVIEINPVYNSNSQISIKKSFSLESMESRKARLSKNIGMQFPHSDKKKSKSLKNLVLRAFKKMNKK